MVETPRPTTYQQDDIHAILELAITRQQHQGEFSRAQLLEIAAELEIPPDCLAQAEQEWQVRCQDDRDRQQFDRLYRTEFHHEAGRYAIISAFVGLFSIPTHQVWPLYLGLLAACALTLKAWQTFHKGVAYERAFQRWQRRRRFHSTLSNVWQGFRRVFQS